MATPDHSTVVNFDPRKERQARRRVLIKARSGGVKESLLDRLFESREDREDRKQFRRNIGRIKMRRTLIARRMATLAQATDNLMAELRRVDHRYPDFDARSLEEARAFVKRAVSSTATCADEYAIFARTRPQYMKGLV